MTEYIGSVFMAIGGIILLAIVLAGIWSIAGSIWISASEKWRRIVKAESLIHEYRKNRKDYLLWREKHGYIEQKDGESNG